MTFGLNKYKKAIKKYNTKVRHKENKNKKKLYKQQIKLKFDEYQCSKK